MDDLVAAAVGCLIGGAFVVGAIITISWLVHIGWNLA